MEGPRIRVVVLVACGYAPEWGVFIKKRIDCIEECPNWVVSYICTFLVFLFIRVEIYIEHQRFGFAFRRCARYGLVHPPSFLKGFKRIHFWAWIPPKAAWGICVITVKGGAKSRVRVRGRIISTKHSGLFLCGVGISR